MRTIWRNAGIRAVAALLLLGFALQSCGGGQKPIDGKTRLLIDSITAASISAASREVDSLCVAERRTRLPYLVDSIIRRREWEIEQKMKTVPR